MKSHPNDGEARQLALLLMQYANGLRQAKIKYSEKAWLDKDAQASSWLGTVKLYQKFFKDGEKTQPVCEQACMLIHEMHHRKGHGEWGAFALERRVLDVLKVPIEIEERLPNGIVLKNTPIERAKVEGYLRKYPKPTLKAQYYWLDE